MSYLQRNKSHIRITNRNMSYQETRIAPLDYAGGFARHCNWKKPIIVPFMLGVYVSKALSLSLVKFPNWPSVALSSLSNHAQIPAPPIIFPTLSEKSGLRGDDEEGGKMGSFFPRRSIWLGSCSFSSPHTHHWLGLCISLELPLMSKGMKGMRGGSSLATVSL